MATNATTELKWLAAEWKKLYKSAVFSGIVGDQAHAARGGYHISREDQPSTNYSVTRPDDKTGRADAASAIDMSMDVQDMRTCTARLIVLFANASDPRRKYVNAFNGWNGSGSAKRYDICAHKVGTATADHKAHVHLEVRRRWCESMIAMRAILSALRGESADEYNRSIGVKTAASKSPAASAKVPAYPGHLLKKGMRDPAVKVLKARMIARGWTSLGVANEVFDAQLVTVMKAFQKQCGVAADGLVGPQTWPLPWTRPIK